MNKSIQKSMRDAFGQAMLALGKQNKKIVVVCADLRESLRLTPFFKKYPERFIEVGVAEQNMMGIAAGLAQEGFVPFVCSFAVFNPGRNWDQLRVSGCYQNANIKIIGSHAGLNVGPDGATHQALEDIAITRCIPNLKVISPADYNECFNATKAIAYQKGPVYMRFPRSESPVLTNPKRHFKLGKIYQLREGKDLSIIATGLKVNEALQISDKLKKGKNINIRVLNCSTIKPIDKKSIIKAAKETKKIVTIEDHQIYGGLGSAVSEVLSQYYPVPMKILGVKDSFGESGTPEELNKKYKLDFDSLKKTVMKFLNAKNAIS